MTGIWWWIWVFLQDRLILSGEHLELEQIVFECVVLLVLMLPPLVQLIAHDEFVAVLFRETLGKFFEFCHFWLTREKGVFQSLLDCQSFIGVDDQQPVN